MKIPAVEYYGDNRSEYAPNIQYGMMKDTINEKLDIGFYNNL